MSVPPPLLAFQVADALGWLGQGLFMLRVLDQWVASERAGRSHVRARFWWMSLVATVLLIAYSLHRRDPVFLLGFLVNLFLYARNLLLLARQERPGTSRRSPVPAVVLGLLVFGGVTLLSVGRSLSLVSYAHPVGWLVVGFAGQALWSARFLVQWYVSERLGRSVLPAAFFWTSLAGAPLLFAWAVHRVDWVMMAAFLFGPIPYVRNLVLIHRARPDDAPAPGATATGRST